MRGRLIGKSFLAALAWLAFSPGSAFAQSAIAGVVKDATGAVLPGLQSHIRRTDHAKSPVVHYLVPAMGRRSDDHRFLLQPGFDSQDLYRGQRTQWSRATPDGR